MNFIDMISQDKFRKVKPIDYVKKIQEKFSKDKTLWLKAISPSEKAEELYQLTHGNYSELWEEHCSICFKNISNNEIEEYYVSEDNITWLCPKCYDQFIKNK